MKAEPAGGGYVASRRTTPAPLIRQPLRGKKDSFTPLSFFTSPLSAQFIVNTRSEQGWAATDETLRADPGDTGGLRRAAE
jgi:hypothetical protein